MPTIPTTKKICPVDTGISSLFEPSAGAELVDQVFQNCHPDGIARMEAHRLRRFQPLFIQVGMVLCIVVYNVVTAIFDQDVGMVIPQIAVLGVDGKVHHVLCPADVEVGMGHMDVLICILLHKIQLAFRSRTASHNGRADIAIVLAAGQDYRAATGRLLRHMLRGCGCG